MEEVKALLNAIIERLDVQNAHMEQMKMDIAQLQGDMKQLKEDVAVLKRDVSSLKEGQARQDKILERLSVRSIEQEAEIVELRRMR
jgi:cell division protein FtsB